MGSRDAARLLLRLTLHPDTPLVVHVLPLAIERLESWGVVIRRTGEAEEVPYELVVDPSRWREMLAQVRTLADVGEVLEAALSEVDGVEASFIFGSILRGEAHEGSDVDVMVLGDRIPSAALGRATAAAAVLLGRDIDVKRFTRAKLVRALEGGAAGWVEAALAGPTRWIVGSEQDLPPFDRKEL